MSSNVRQKSRLSLSACQSVLNLMVQAMHLLMGTSRLAASIQQQLQLVPNSPSHSRSMTVPHLPCRAQSLGPSWWYPLALQVPLSSRCVTCGMHNVTLAHQAFIPSYCVTCNNCRVTLYTQSLTSSQHTASHSHHRALV